MRSSQRAARFDWPRVLDRYLEIYGELVGTQHPRWPRRQVRNASETASSNEQPPGKAPFVRVVNSDANLRNFPDFLIVGPQRTGTTWLFHHLKSHPEIFLPKEKELYYFSTLGMPDHRRFRFPYLEDYLGVMADTPRSTFKRNYDSLRKVGRLLQSTHPRRSDRVVCGPARGSHSRNRHSQSGDQSHSDDPRPP